MFSPYFCTSLIPTPLFSRFKPQAGYLKKVLKTLKGRINRGFQVSFSTFCIWAKLGEMGVFWA